MMHLRCSLASLLAAGAALMASASRLAAPQPEMVDATGPFNVSGVLREMVEVFLENEKTYFKCCCAPSKEVCKLVNVQDAEFTFFPSKNGCANLAGTEYHSYFRAKKLHMTQGKCILTDEDSQKIMVHSNSGHGATTGPTYEDALQCLRPTGALGNKLTVTSLEIVLLQQQQDPQLALHLLQQLRPNTAERVLLEDLQALLRGKLQMPDADLVAWHDLLTRACFGLDANELVPWRTDFAQIDINQNGYITQYEFEHAPQSVSQRVIYSISLLFGSGDSLIELPGLGFYQFVRGVSVQLGELLYRSLITKRGQPHLTKTNFFTAVWKPSTINLGSLSNKALDLVWKGLDHDMDDLVTKEELTDGILMYFHTIEDGLVRFRPEDDIFYQDRRIKKYTQQCEAAVAEECLGRTCPKFCLAKVGGKPSSKEFGLCSDTCTQEARCRSWQPGLPTFESGEDVLEKQTFSQVIACVAQARHTSGYSNGDWKVITSPSYRDMLAYIVEKHLLDAWVKKSGVRVPEHIMELGDTDGGMKAAAVGVLMAISTSEKGTYLDEGLLRQEAHRGWYHHIMKRYPELKGQVPLPENLEESMSMEYAPVVRTCLEVLRS